MINKLFLDGLRIRASRLMRGEFRSDDLTKLFLFARENCGGRVTVREIGDFVAHNDERTKGTVLRTSKDWAVIARVWLMLRNELVKQDCMPIDFPDYLIATFKRSDPKHIRKKTNLSYRAAGKLLKSIVSRFSKNSDGTLSMAWTATDSEVRLISCLANVLIPHAAFDDTKLFSDFSVTLRNHGILRKSELSLFNAVKPVVSMFAISTLHNSIVRFDDGTRGELYANKASNDCLEVSVATVVHTLDDGGESKFASKVFSTSLVAAENCDNDLLKHEQPWSFDLEINSELRLCRLK